MSKVVKTIILAGFIVAKFLLQFFLISPFYDLHRDEYLHLDQGNHLALGYLSVPPVTSWISFLIKILGNDIFFVKFFPALFGALTIFVVWKSIELLKGNLFALILGSTGVLLSILLRLNTLYQPNSLDVLCWTTFFYMLIRYFNSENSRWLFYAAVLFAIGFLNKYNVILLLLGLFPAILLTPNRNLLVRKNFYLAILVGLILILPNLIWQYANNFPVVHHMKELTKNQLVNVSLKGFLTSQILFFAGSVVVIISGLYALLFYNPFQKYKVFFWSFVFTLAVFIFFKAKDYYVIGLYPIYIAFGSVFLESILNHGWKIWLRPILIMLPVLFFIPMYNYALPNRTPDYVVKHHQKYSEIGMLYWEDGKEHELPQDFADMVGWKELAGKVDKAYSGLPDKEHTLILCDNYGQAGAINYYSKLGIKAVSFNADYINWFDLSKKYVNVIRVKDYFERDNEMPETSPFFAKSSISGEVENKYAREYGTTIFVFQNAKININKRIQNEINEVKSRQK